jgi:hypothetical protein
MRRHGLMRALLRLRLLGSGVDDYILPGDGDDDGPIYQVTCSNCMKSYDSYDWLRTCKLCGAPVESTRK